MDGGVTSNNTNIHERGDWRLGDGWSPPAHNPSWTKAPNHAKLQKIVKKKLEQGITDFKKFIDNDCYFVDKTRLIAHLIDHPSEVHLITRPRRFGKTLNLSMIRYFFEAPVPGERGDSTDAPPNAPLFNGLSITDHPQYSEYMGQYPVIALSFKDAKGASCIECMEIIRNMLSVEYQRHEYLQNCEVFHEADKELFSKILNRKGSSQDCAQAIKLLSIWLHRAYNKPVYILLDEYDTPLHAAYTGGFYDEMIGFIRSFMVQTFKDNPNLKQAVVIGILKVAQESIFSDFNNPAVSTLLNAAMKDCFGFTEAEVEAMAAHYEQQSKLENIRRWYNGYIFGGDTVIYNPWSLVSYFRNIEDGLLPYWVNTSSNALVQNLLQMNRAESRETVLQLLGGEEIRKKVINNIAYPQIEKRQEAAWSFLLHAGYLKATDRRQREYGQDYRLSIPNKEVHTVYSDIIINWLEDELRGGDDFLAFIGGVNELDSRRIALSLERMLLAMASYHDMASKSGEMFYHGLLLGLTAYMADDYMVESNREYGMGRADITLISRGFDGKRAQKAILFELKQLTPDDERPLEEAAQEAHSQALERYSVGVKIKYHPKRCLVLGVGFRGKEVKTAHSFEG